MKKDNREKLLREALSVFLDLRENPEDPETLRKRDAFLARGEEERKAYETAAKALNAGRAKPPSKIGGVVLLGALLSMLVIFALGEVNTWVLADAKTRGEIKAIPLASGDIALLDADTAIRDRTLGDVRQVSLLEGAGFFDVQSLNVPFEVMAGDLTVKVLGTKFEVSRFDRSVLVAVQEGTVEVKVNAETWRLSAGQRLIWTEAQTVRVRDVATTGVAGWRRDKLETDGMTFGQVINILDRRLPGNIVVSNDALSRLEMSGVIDLQRPSAALSALLLSVDAKRYELPNVLSVIR